jgi:hypothetical protein
VRGAGWLRSRLDEVSVPRGGTGAG